MIVQFVFLCSLLVLVWANPVNKNCYWNSKCDYVNYGSTTVYDDIRGDLREAADLEGCNPVAVWALVRHGTRYPLKSSVQNMKNAAQLKNTIVQNNLHRRQGELCAQDVSNLQKWSWDSNIETSADLLMFKGYSELYDLGYRFHQKFLPLLNNLDTYTFKSTRVLKTERSAVAFTRGLGQGYWQFDLTDIKGKNLLLSSYRHCPKYMVDITEASYNELNNYLNSTDVKQMLSNVQRRAGLKQLSLADVSGLYNLCRFERAYAATKKSPWCALFTKEDLDVLEYSIDILHYHKNSYGSPLSTKFCGRVFTDLLQTFQNTVSEFTKSFTAYFTHKSFIQMAYTALGLYQDANKITGFKRDPQRKWRSGVMAPLAGNFVAVLHKCSNETNSHQVQFFTNEIEVPLCGSRTCSWKEFTDKLEPHLDTNLEFCNDLKYHKKEEEYPLEETKTFFE